MELEMKFEYPQIPLFKRSEWATHDIFTMTWTLKDGAPLEIVESFEEWKKERERKDNSGYDF